VIEIPFDPSFPLGPVRVAWHSFFSYVGLLAGSWVAFRCARYLIRDGRIYAFAIAVVIGGLVGARAMHLLDSWPRYEDRPLAVLAIWDGGIGTMGAPLGSSIAGYVAARRLRLPVGFMFDTTVIGIALGLAIGRIGDIINGEHHAAACAGLPWCVGYTHPATLGQPGPVHPVVAYDLLWDLVIFVVAYAVWRRVRGHEPEGRVWLLFLLLYGAGRAVSSNLRLDPLVWAGLQGGQLAGILYAATGASGLVWAWRRSAHTTRG
jgi:phosphatidylglycerol:prolipoprotein diacylglycerol transferase